MDVTYFNENTSLAVRKFSKNTFVNQLGYKPYEAKKAVFKTDVSEYTIVGVDDKVYYRGKPTYFGVDEFSGDEVWVADFSDFKTEGRYFIMANNEKSLCFSIAENVYQNAFFDITKAFYFLRCGKELKEEYAGEFTHKACHNTLAVLYGEEDKSFDVSGGWHDAGDYGRYITAGACALAHILFAYKMYPQKFENLNLNIPESKSRVPDILEECRYELEWFLKMQREDGGVYHKVTTMVHAPFVMPEDDKKPLYIFPVSSMATADFAAICAMASGIYKKFDTAFADKLIKAAKKAELWLDKNPEFLGFRNPEGCNTGPYGEWDDKDNRFWAYCELFLETGEAIYHQKMEKYLEYDFDIAALGYGSVGGFGALSYILSDNKNKSERFKKMFEAEFIKRAYELQDMADKCGYGAAMNEDCYCWGSNMILLKHAMTFAIADFIEKKGRFKKYTFSQLDYLFGINATGYSYVTENGEFSSVNPHLRPTFADGIDKCIPGYVCGGPNRHPGDPDAKELLPPGTPPMKCYADVVSCYSLNEITIYWNSPAVFAIASIL